MSFNITIKTMKYLFFNKKKWIHNQIKLNIIKDIYTTFDIISIWRKVFEMRVSMYT